MVVHLEIGDATAELNIWVDAEAAKRVLKVNCVNVFGLDVTHEFLADDHMIERFGSC